MNERLDRDLLVGLIALRAGDIAHEDLLDLLRDWSRDGRRPLSVELVARGAIDEARGEAIERLAANPATAWPSIRYKVESHYRDGGVGRVSIATDDELHRRVAYKEMKEPYVVDPRRRERFLLEAEVTGRLEHPGIVPVYGLGTDARGRPFYAMRFIEGIELQHAIEAYHEGRAKFVRAGDRALALRDLLNRLIAACQAISYAHSRGVIHRDIKPRNILLGKFGETVLIDWGLAKPLGDPEADAGPGEGPLVPESGSGSDVTLPGDRHGTLGFISPEHAKDGVVGPAGDIYALGATLYTILTGRPPLGSTSWPLFLERLMAADYPSPRQVAPEISPSLEAVCLRALATDPADRYANPSELAADLSRWLADLPVAAHPDPFSARVGRWARRHRSVVAGSAMTLVVSVAILSWSLVVIADQKARAESNFQLSLVAVEDTLGSFRSTNEHEWTSTPGLVQVRRQLIPSGIKVLRELHARRPDDPRVRRQLAQMALDLSHMQRLAGDPGESLETSAMALELNQSLRTEFPLDVSLAERDASLHLDRCHAALQRGDPGLAEAEARKVIAMEDVVGLNRMPWLRGSLALADILASRGSLAESRALADRVVAELPRFRPHLSAGDSFLSLSLSARSSQAHIARLQGDHSGARRTLEDAIGGIPARVEVNIAYFKSCLQRDLADVLLGSSRDLDLADKLASEAMRRFDEIATDFPSIIRYKIGLAEATLIRGLVRFKRTPGRPVDAEADAIEAIRLVEGPARKASNREDLHLVNAGACRLLARVAMARDQKGDAGRLLRRALEEYARASEVSPGNLVIKGGRDEAVEELRRLDGA